MRGWYSVNDGRIRISSDSTSFEWEGLIDNRPVLDLIVPSHRRYAIVLLDPPPGDGLVHNLVCVKPDASIAWRAALPAAEGADAYVEIEAVDCSVILASTWSGYAVTISQDTGQVIRKAFAK